MVTKSETESNGVKGLSFHSKRPWILASLRSGFIHLWDYRMATLIHLFHEHNGPVRGLHFHKSHTRFSSPEGSECDDCKIKTVSVWDIGALRKKTESPADGILRLYRMIADFFGGFDAVVKYVLDGHGRGVKWVSFHPTLPLIVSGADDCQLKVWRMNGTKAWEVEGTWTVFLVFCFIQGRRSLYQIQKTRANLLAAGHDSGMIVFKLERERPAFSVSGDSVLYVKDWFLPTFEYSTQKDTQLMPIRRPGSNTTAEVTQIAIEHFVSIIHTIPLPAVERRRDVDEVKEMLIRAKEYILGLRIDLKRREVKDDPVREQELAALFTHCKLEVSHLRVALASAMFVCYNAKNLSAAANYDEMIPLYNKRLCLFSSAIPISATGFTVLGIVNKLLTVVINLVIWDKHSTVVGTIGLLICMGGGIMYQRSTSGKPKPASREGAQQADEEQQKLLEMQCIEENGEGERAVTQVGDGKS
ncbi:hypothetical protein SASPL_113036 [Salvia splendens]|uniref:Coatomer alpha subunit C-terminal domain-containing protein n=1 Tax=Salvia splendens TaxID=180675 RepID=A0A8X8Y0Y1_SALSN|nr:hypothetical protein SASPL_113036 [Salvia splendens]